MGLPRVLLALTLAVALAGCSSAPPAGQAPRDIVRLQLQTFTDDVDCEGTMDVPVLLSALPAGDSEAVPFTGRIDAELIGQLAGGAAEQRVRNWTFEVKPPDFGPDGRYWWWVDGHDLRLSTEYRLDVRAATGGKRLSASAEFDWPPTVSAKGLAAC